MASGPGPQQTFPQHLTAIHFLGGDWIVVSVKASRSGVSGNSPYSINDWEDYENGGTKDGETLEKFPFNADKPASFKPPQIDDDHPEWRGNKNEDSTDEFTALYFLHNEKKESASFVLQFPGYGSTHPSTDIGYYVWPTETLQNGQQPPPPPADAAQALELIPGTIFPYVARFNNENAWFDSWLGWINQITPLVPLSQIAVKPTGNHFGWTSAHDAEMMKDNLNTYANWFNSQPGAGVNFFTWPHYTTLSYDFSIGGPGTGSSSATYTVDVYRIRANNLIFDQDNKLKIKLPTGKNHATRTFTQGQPSDTRKLRVTWAPKPGIAIVDA